MIFLQINLILNYVPTNLLSTERLTPNLTNNFVEKIQFLIKIYTKKTLETRKSKNTKKQNYAKKKRISNCSTIPKQNKNYNNINRKKKTY